MMEEQYESKVIGHKTAYWKFKENATPSTFAQAFEEFNAMVQRSEIENLMVHVEMKDAWGRNIQDIWIKTGEVADLAGIKKWVVISPEKTKELTIKHLVKGAGAKRQYSYFITNNEQQGHQWLKGS